jgi:hypothetical protein
MKWVRIFIVVIGSKKLTLEEQESLFRILFENSNEEPTSAVYEIYDTITELVGDISNLEVTKITIH